MGTFTGTNADELIKPDDISESVTAEPPGSTPGGGADTLIGLGGDDYLDGGGGSDSLIGGDGDDTYVIRDSEDVVTEMDTESGGTDTVQSSISYTLGAGLENLSLKGSAPTSGTGNALDNVLVGNSGDNALSGGAGDDRLDGGAGEDLLIGGEGDDTYEINAAGDVVVEDASKAGGVDAVLAAVSFKLGTGLEHLTLTGSAEINGTGNKFANVITGNGNTNLLKGAAGKDRLDGGSGGDVLKGGQDKDRLDGGQGLDKLAGGGGNDEFLFSKVGQGGDIIVDLQDEKGNNDRILVAASSFKGGLEVGRLSADLFQAGANHLAESKETRFIFDTSDNTLWFDKNGSKSGGLTLLADLQGDATVNANDIFII